jgi:Kef-type K+ transport system membrane component KefB
MSFAALALVVAAGLLGPVLAALPRFGPPVIVGQIAAGVVIGSSGFHWVDPADPFITGLATIGFALLMFIVGTHLPVRDVQLRAALATGACLTAFVVALAVVAGLGLSHVVTFHRPGILAVLLATSSGAVALPVLQELRLTDRPALVTTAWIAIADVGTVLALPLVLATGAIGKVLLGGALVILSGVALYFGANFVRHHRVVAHIRRLSRERGWGLDLRISLLALFTCAWIATRFGTSILIAGFTVGVVVALLGEPRRVAQQLVGLGEGFLIPLFFVHLGTQLDFAALARSADALRLAALLAVVAIAIHIAAAALWRLPISMGLLATAQLGVPSAIVSLGLASNQLTPAQGSAVMAAVLVTLGACALGGVMAGHTGRLTDASAPTLDAPTLDAPPA